MSTESATPTAPAEELDMGALLDLEAARDGSLRRGEIVEGMVLGASPDGLIVDVGTKTEALIPPGEMRSLGASGRPLPDLAAFNADHASRHLFEPECEVVNEIEL